MQKEGVTLKDLKHLIYFESLLEDANNELVRQAHEEGGVTLGYTCFRAPAGAEDRLAGHRNVLYVQLHLRLCPRAGRARH